MNAAVLSKCGQYRYSLKRSWMLGSGAVMFVMLNPSTADANLDDPTIRRCIGFAKDWGYQRLIVTNLFALRSTDRRGLLSAVDPVGDENDQYILDMASQADRIVLAWGSLEWVPKSHRTDFEMQAIGTAELLEFTPETLHCLGTTKDGSPRHPLYVPASFKPQRFDMRWLLDGRDPNELPAGCE